MRAEVAGPTLIFPNGVEYQLREDVAIGRDAGNDLVLPTKSVSRQHALITQANGRWFIEDRGSFNGTMLNDDRIRPGVPLPLRHSDRIKIGPLVLVFSSPTEGGDTDTEVFAESSPVYSRHLSPLQRRVVGCLCAPWMAGGSLDRLPTNEEIAAELGTPGATETVKAALRRAYAKAGVSDLPAHAKRRALCRIARQRGWI
jgi:pSer/pThr/pTyr-binding forkhead associated (FHA) protein